MKIAILNRSDLSVASFYDADAPNQASYGGRWADPTQTIHVEIPEEINHLAAEFEWDNNEVVVSENSELAAIENVKVVEVAIRNAIAFGQKMMTKFAAQNVMLGITQDGQTGVVLDKMAPVMAALQSGSLYEAISRAQAIDSQEYDSKYVTHARIMSFVNEIEAYLGLPLSL